jgi:hypothetical protein
MKIVVLNSACRLEHLKCERDNSYGCNRFACPKARLLTVYEVMIRTSKTNARDLITAFINVQVHPVPVPSYFADH